MKCGTVVRLEFREPVKGEFYDFFGYAHLDFFHEDTYPNWDRWKQHVAGYRLRNMCLHDGTDECDMAKWGYVVMVPV